MNITLQRTAFTDNDTINSAAFNAQSCLSAAIADGQSYLFGLGTAGAPSVGFLGDADTGLYSPGADQLALVTGGVTRLGIAATGAVTVAGALAVAGLLTATGGLTGDVVGGLTAPLGTAALPSIDFAGDTNTGIYSPGADQLALVTGGVTRLGIAATGAVTVGGALTASGGVTGNLTGNVTGNVTGTLTAPLGAVGTPSLTFSGDTNTGLFSPGADQLALVTGGVTRLTVDAAGILKMGTAVGAKLHLFDNGTDFIGLGIQSALLQIYANSATSRIGLGYGTSAAFTETLSILGNKVGVGRTNPAYTLTVAGNGSDNSLTAGVGIVDTGTGGRVFVLASRVGCFTISDETAASPRLVVKSTGILQLNAYGAGMLVADASGNVASTTAPAVASLTATGSITVNSGASPSGTVRNVTISTAAPSGGADGDVWLQYTA